MKQRDAANDPTLRALAQAMRDDPKDGLAGRAFDDRCEELGVRFGNRIFWALFLIACQSPAGVRCSVCETPLQVDAEGCLGDPSEILCPACGKARELAYQEIPF